MEKALKPGFFRPFWLIAAKPQWAEEASILEELSYIDVFYTAI
jgi:hypothetical protein